MFRFGLICFLLTGILAHQRAPPGINPNQYHGQQQHHKPPPPPNPQYQQQQQQHHQQQQYQAGAPGVPQPQHQQYQQPPQPQQQQPPQAQQYQPQPPSPQAPYQAQQQQPPPPPPPHQHAGGHQQQQRVLHNTNLNTERDHIKEHLQVPLDTSGMSEQELQFHYFKMHDADNNNKLDGQELIKSLFHWHDETNHDPSKTGHAPPENKLFKDEELVSMIDPILDQDDRNRDGYIDYPEFVQAQRNAANNAKG